MNVNRRNFLKNATLVGAGLAIGFSFGKGGKLFRVDTAEKGFELTPFILICKDGTITIVNPNPDMGQGSTQAIPALIAEELEVSLENIRVMQSDGNSRYGTQISGGSGSVRRAFEPLRKAGAAAREMLIKAASERWHISSSECFAELGYVHHRKNAQKIAYADLIEAAAKMEVPQNPPLKAKKDFKILGKMATRPDVVTRVSGKAIYGIDVDVPNMVYATVAHAPNILGNVISIDSTAASKIPGVLSIFPAERKMPHRTAQTVAVVAESYWAALTARKLLNVTWDHKGDHLDTSDYFREMHNAISDAGLVHFDKGKFDKHYNAAENALESVYETPFAAHVPIEPECATVHVKDDGTVEVWAPVQGPDWARTDIAKYLNVIPEKIKIHVTLLGGSFGRKSYHDFVLEACFISRHIGLPVKLIWTREDDITQGPYRAGMLSHMQGFYQTGKVFGMHHHAIGESIDGQVNNNLKKGVADEVLCGEINSQYDLEFFKISYTRVTTDIPIVWWRSVYASNLSWGQECFIDELAHAAGIDPLKARLIVLKDSRFRNVLNELADRSQYNEKCHGMAKGVAIWKCFETICAACITVEQIDQGIRVKKVVSVIDCGIYINPDMVKAQTEGNIIMGLTAALNPGITFTKGKCDQNNFHQYGIMRINSVPEIEVHIIESDENPGGVGEPGLPPVAPALGNAIFHLTGKRIRKLPIDLNAP